MATLKREDDEDDHMGALSQLCEMLSISSEEQLSMMPIEQLVPLLVRLALCMLEQHFL